MFAGLKGASNCMGSWAFTSEPPICLPALFTSITSAVRTSGNGLARRARRSCPSPS